QSSQKELVTVGKIGVLFCAAIALGLAIWLADELGSIFSYIQEFQGFLSPGALAVFLFGFFVPKCPRFFGWLGIAINVVEYSLIKVCFPEVAFLNRMAICLITIVAIGAILTAINSARGAEPIILKDKGIIAMDSSKGAKFAGIIVCIATVALYILFW
ncbi:MAG: transporter, partial [Akkermansia sp.]